MTTSRRKYGDLGEFKWEEPPPSQRGRKTNKNLDELVERLKEKPGSWALVRKNASSGGSSTYKLRGLETCYRKSGKDEKGNYRYDIYVKYEPPVGG